LKIEGRCEMMSPSRGAAFHFCRSRPERNYSLGRPSFPAAEIASDWTRMPSGSFSLIDIPANSGSRKYQEFVRIFLAFPAPLVYFS
jgi:hypothetical protein